jgi:hypothetical protein
MTGPRFVEPPRSLFRRREHVDPGLLAVAGAVVALLFLLITVAMFQRA